MEISSLIPPYGGNLVDLLVRPDEFYEAKARASCLPSLRLSERAVCDLELLAIGAFSPLDRFMGKEDYRRVLEEMRLADGSLFPIPVTLPVEPGADIRLDRSVALRGSKNELLAMMTIDEIYEWDPEEAAQKVLGTRDPSHPLVEEMRRWGRLNISGRLKALQLPAHYDFKSLRLTPAETRERLAKFNRENVVAFQTRNPLHRAHEELTRRAIQSTDGVLLLHPVVGMTKPGDTDHFSRVRAYKVLIDRYYDPNRALLALLPLAMRMAGPREALWHALIRRNYGANHLIIGRDHASPGKDSKGAPFYGPFDAQEMVSNYYDELGVKPIPFRDMVYIPEENRYEDVSRIHPQTRVLSISGTETRELYLNRGLKPPEWLIRPEVAEILSEAFPPLHRQGVCVWFTGLSGAGKSTTAEILTVLLAEHGRRVTLLDGDLARVHLSKGLGFSKEDRDANVRRIGIVASEIARHGGVAVCAAVSPYRAARDEARSMMAKGHFVEVFVDTPLEVCEERDVKGIYAQARAGRIKGLTGIDDPYEPPKNPELTLDTINHSAEDNARLILEYLCKRGFVRADESGGRAQASHA